MPAEPSSPAPESVAADIRAAVAAYDRRAEVTLWHGPRYRMTWRALGRGPTLILVPGLGATYRVYALLLNRLAEHFRTVVYDYPGDHPDDGAELARIAHADLAADLLGLIDHLGAGRVCLHGPSFGSTVVLRALRVAPDRFAAAAVQGAFAFRPFRLAERLALVFGRRFPGTVARIPLHDRVVTWMHKRSFPATQADRWDHFIEENGRTPIAAMVHRLDLLGRLDLRPLLPEIATEVLLLQGTVDRLVPRPHFEVLRAGLPHAHAVLLPGVGHQPHYTHAEDLARRLTEFLRPRVPG
ncbi:MAG TPA: alpha/beta hydrolase [Isosphaeraceae bacterium]|jgi:aminoacrylate hydrolase